MVSNALKYTEDEWAELWELRPKEVQTCSFGVIRRRQGNFSDEDIPAYEFTGCKVKAEPLSKSRIVQRVLSDARRREREANGEANASRMNAVFANWYMQQEKIGSHRDSEQGLVDGAPIYSYSLQPSGPPRQFNLKYDALSGIDKRLGIPKLSSVPTRRIKLPDRSLLIMQGQTQREFKHEVPFLKHDSGLRINLTVRAFQTH